MIDKRKFRNLKGRRIYLFWLDENTGEITDVTSRSDVVQVIRCKDCVAWDEEEQHGCAHDMGANDYCSKAERKDVYVMLHYDDIHFKGEESEKAFYDALAERKEE